VYRWTCASKEQTALIHLITEQNRQLSDSLCQLDLALSPWEMLVKKGDCLALFAYVEAGKVGLGVFRCCR
jgi:hypothetical protein